ncbi:MAG TPA: hypothetical protein DD400_05790 [Rhodospirillaceae bacterium]|nr:hypothetical protein [Rhodospirillaceae bacterium]
MGTKQNIAIELSAVIVGVSDGQPQIWVGDGPSLPSGPLETGHRTLEQGLRNWVWAQSKLNLGYVEQLYTFADKNRTAAGKRIVSIGYLALRSPQKDASNMANWYDFFPWEDHRKGPPKVLLNSINKNLMLWKKKAKTPATKKERQKRIAINFPKDSRAWNEELVLQRYELLWETGLIEEATGKKNKKNLIAGKIMKHDHRRILATGIARLRAKIKYRPVVFELLPSRFTLLQLQETVEALAGVKLHKQNFRRLIQTQGLVEETGSLSQEKKGRPAKLFAFRHTVRRERAAGGAKLSRSS